MKTNCYKGILFEAGELQEKAYILLISIWKFIYLCLDKNFFFLKLRIPINELSFNRFSIAYLMDTHKKKYYMNVFFIDLTSFNAINVSLYSELSLF